MKSAMKSLKAAMVTGAGGFLGSHLSERLIRDGYQVIGIDNFCTGLASNQQYLTKKYGEKIFFLKKDVVNDWPEILSAIENHTEDLKYIFHFASPASPPHYQRLSLETIWANTLGLENVLKLADQTGASGARVIFASTSEVYGDPEINPQPESYWGKVNSYGPRSCYDEAKRCGEALLYSWNLRHQTKHGLVRIFNTYGPRMNPDDGRVVINFLTQALQGKNLSVYGDGKQSRSFCYVDDLIEGIVRYAQTKISTPVNLGNPNEFTILELAKMVQNIFADKKLQLTFHDLPGDDPKQRRPDISKAYKELDGWKPQIPLEQGLRHMIDWLKTEVK